MPAVVINHILIFTTNPHNPSSGAGDSVPTQKQETETAALLTAGIPISFCHSPIPVLGSPPLDEASQASRTSVILSLWAHLRHLPSEAKPGPQLLQPPSTSITLSTSANQTSPWRCLHVQKAYVCFPALGWEVGVLRGIPKCSSKFSTVPVSHTQ